MDIRRKASFEKIFPPAKYLRDAYYLWNQKSGLNLPSLNQATANITIFV